jgi:hypothetical protein
MRERKERREREEETRASLELLERSLMSLIRNRALMQN